MSAKQAAAKPGKDVIYVDVDDEITSIIDKVESSKQKVVALVLPKRMASLQSIVNMRLLKRSAGHSNKSVVLITSEAALLPLAGAAGLHVAKNLQSMPAVPDSPLVGVAHHPEPEEPEAEAAQTFDQEDLQKTDYRKSIGTLAAAHEEPEEIALDNDTTPAPAAGEEASKKAHKNKVKAPKVPSISRMRLMLFGGLGVLVLLILLFVLASTALTKATITVTTTSTPVSLNTNLTASGGAKSLDEAAKVIPSVLKTSNQTSTQQATATGQKNLGNKASGTASFINCSQDGSSITVPAGTGVSAGNLSFITQQAVVLPNSAYFGGSCKNNIPNTKGSSGITAQNPGANYNIGNSSFTVAGYSTVSASGSASGGSDNNVTVLQQSDVESAAAKVGSSNAASFEQTFENQLASQGYYVFTSTMQAASPALTSSPAVGQQATTAQVTITITHSVLAVQKSDLTTFVTNALNKQIDQKKEKLSDSNVLAGLNINVQNQNQADATLVLNKSTTALPILDDQSIKSYAAGKKTGDIQNYINSYPGVKNVDVKYSPFWISKAPKNPTKIKIVQKQVKSGS